MYVLRLMKTKQDEGNENLFLRFIFLIFKMDSFDVNDFVLVLFCFKSKFEMTCQADQKGATSLSI